MERTIQLVIGVAIAAIALLILSGFVRQQISRPMPSQVENPLEPLNTPGDTRCDTVTCVSSDGTPGDCSMPRCQGDICVPDAVHRQSGWLCLTAAGERGKCDGNGVCVKT